MKIKNCYGDVIGEIETLSSIDYEQTTQELHKENDELRKTNLLLLSKKADLIMKNLELADRCGMRGIALKEACKDAENGWGYAGHKVDCHFLGMGKCNCGLAEKYKQHEERMNK